jgi:hypothetical protein
MIFFVHPRRIFVAAILALGMSGSVACRGDLAAVDKPTPSSSHHQTELEPIKPPALNFVLPETETDMERAIRKELTRAIDQDPLLKHRQIIFVIDDGDVSVTGLVQTETERQRINELAMAVRGVRSVANALRVSPG